MKSLYIIGGIAFAISSTSFAQGTPWLLEPGANSLSITQVHQTADSFTSTRFADGNLPDDLELDTTWISYSRGLTDDLALDFRTGYARSTFDPLPESSLDGRTDTSIGLSWRVLDEFISEDVVPSTAIRVGLVLQGNYDTGTVNAIGDGADAAEISVVSGKVINEFFAVSGELGYRFRNSDVSDEYFYKFAAYASPLSQLTLSLSYSGVDAKEGLELGGPDFNGQNFHRLEEDTELIDIGASYRINDAISLGVNAGKVVDGKNTAESDVYALTLGYGF